jgi:tetratricopeptide (TPR) repeat protein
MTTPATPATPRAHSSSTRLSALALALAVPVLAHLGGCSGPNPAPFRISGDAAFNATQWARAAEAYEQYLEIRPGDSAIRTNLGIAYMNLGDYAKAAQNLRLVYTASPSNDRIVNLLAESLARGEKLDELFRLLRSEAIDSQQTADWMRLGRYAMRLGDKDIAQTAFLTAAKVDAGQSAEPHLALFDYYRAMGNRPEAITRLRYAAYIDPQSHELRKRFDLVSAGSGSGSDRAIMGPTFPLRPPEAGPQRVPTPPGLQPGTGL